MMGSSREGTPWKSALNTRPPSQNAWASGGHTATEYLLSSVSVKVRHEDLKAPRKERNTGDNVDREPWASEQTPKGVVAFHMVSVVRFLSPSGVAALEPRHLPSLILNASPLVDHYVTAEAVTGLPVPEVAPTHARE